MSACPFDNSVCSLAGFFSSPAKINPSKSGPPHIHLLTSEDGEQYMWVQRVSGEGGALSPRTELGGELGGGERTDNEKIHMDPLDAHRIEYVVYEKDSFGASKDVDQWHTGGGQISKFNIMNEGTPDDVQAWIDDGNFKYQSTLHTFNDVEETALRAVDYNGDGIPYVKDLNNLPPSKQWGDIAGYESAHDAEKTFQTDIFKGGLGTSECCIFNEFGGGGCGPCGR